MIFNIPPNSINCFAIRPRQLILNTNPSVKVFGVEPTLGHTIQGLKNMQEAIVPDIYDPSRLDDKIVMQDGIAFETARRLATEEGIFAGISSGAAVAGALEVARQMDSGTVVTIVQAPWVTMLWQLTATGGWNSVRT